MTFLQNWDTTKKISVWLNIILLLLLCGIGLGWDRLCPKCDSFERVTVIHDTVYPSDKPVVIFEGKPEPVKQKKLTQRKKKQLEAILPQISEVVGIDKGKPEEVPIIEDKEAAPCDYLTTYTFDTIIPNQAHITLNQEVVGYVTWQQIEYANLTPQVTTTITKVPKEKIKCYLGIAGTFNGNEFRRWGIGAQGALAIPKVGAVTYYYDAKNNAHTAGFLALIRFKK